MLKKLVLVVFALAVCLTNVSFAGVIDDYVARLSPEDHFNSKGVKLTTVGAIVRQDRANFHKFGKKDGEDTYDSFCTSASNRAALERLINKSHISSSTKQAILNGTPLIEVTIYIDSVDVQVIGK